MKTKINTKAMLEAHKDALFSRAKYDYELNLLKTGNAFGTQEKVDRAKDEMDAKIKAFNDAASTLSAAIKEAEGRATARTITARDIISRLKEIEKGLNISKKNMNGVSVHVDENAQTFPSAYKFTPESTHFFATFKGGSWIITGIERARCGSASKKVTITLTEEAKAAIIDRIEAGLL